VLREIVESNQDTPPLPDLGDQEAIAAEYTQGNLQRDIANSLCGRQSRLDIVISSDYACDRANGRNDA
jgi:hypothetical protein